MHDKCLEHLREKEESKKSTERERDMAEEGIYRRNWSIIACMHA